MRRSHLCSLVAAWLVASACGADPAGSRAAPRIVARLVIDPSPAKAVHLEVSGPGTGEFTVDKPGVAADQWSGSTSLGLLLFGEALDGAIGSFPDVDLDGPRLELVRVIDAVGSDNLPLPPGSVTARVVIDTIR